MRLIITTRLISANVWQFAEVPGFRSSHHRCSVKKGVLRNFAKFAGKHLCQSLFFNKVAGLRLWHRCFPVNFAKFLRTYFFIEHIHWLLLHFRQCSYSIRPEIFENLWWRFFRGYRKETLPWYGLGSVNFLNSLKSLASQIRYLLPL